VQSPKGLKLLLPQLHHPEANSNQLTFACLNSQSLLFAVKSQKEFEAFSRLDRIDASFFSKSLLAGGLY
jgi:hypothetical protein